MKEFYVSCILVEANKVYQVGKGEKQEQRHEDVKTKDTISSLKQLTVVEKKEATT